MPHHVQHDLLRDGLQRKGDVAMPVAQRLPRRSRRPEHLEELRAERPQLSERQVGEIVHVDVVPTLGGRPHDIAEARDVGVVAEGGERHHLALVAETGKAEVFGDERVDEAQRVHLARVPEPFEPVALADVGAGRGIVPVAVHDEDQRLLHRRYVERGGVRVVMPDVHDLGQSRARSEVGAQPPPQILVQQHDLVLLRPVRCRREQAEAQREPAQELLQREPAQLGHVPRRRHDVDVGKAELQVFAQRGEREPRELLGFLAAVETLFLEHDVEVPVAQEREATVVRLRYDPEYPHVPSLSRFGAATPLWRTGLLTRVLQAPRPLVRHRFRAKG